MSKQTKHESRLKKFMTLDQRAKIGNLPTYHLHCFDKTGVSRPGKTARDKAKKGVQ
jgi:hypothetical protein|tara:strand:- start:335 stop:502 length:168 start_codon:yes stop_codon:yes gene_type:complete